MKKRIALLILPILLMSLSLASCDGKTGDSSEDSSSSSTIDPSTEYTVSFDLNYPGAPTPPPSQTVLVNGLVTKPADPTRDTYDFTHWSTDFYGNDEWNFTTDVVVSNMTLYAGWSLAEVPEKIYYVDVPTFWKTDGAVVSIFMWQGATDNTWPGVRMTHVSGDIYSYTIPSTYTDFIFARVSPTDPITYWNSKTIDLSVSGAGANNLFTIAETVSWGNTGCQGVWSLYQA